jgi:hypothetical protein
MQVGRFWPFRCGRLLVFQFRQFWQFWQSWQSLFGSRDDGALGRSRRFLTFPITNLLNCQICNGDPSDPLPRCHSEPPEGTREEPRGSLPHRCRCREFSLENVSAVPNRRTTIIVSACHVERRAAQASRLGVETSRGCLRFHAASGNSCKEPGWSRHSCLR